MSLKRFPGPQIAYHRLQRKPFDDTEESSSQPEMAGRLIDTLKEASLAA